MISNIIIIKNLKIKTYKIIIYEKKTKKKK